MGHAVAKPFRVVVYSVELDTKVSKTLAYHAAYPDGTFGPRRSTYREAAADARRHNEEHRGD